MEEEVTREEIEVAKPERDCRLLSKSEKTRKGCMYTYDLDIWIQSAGTSTGGERKK